jgi:two-component system chemotaxis response regulator CheY
LSISAHTLQLQKNETMSKRVLIVDDSATIRQQVRLALSQAGFDVVEATDGEDGVAKIRNDLTICAVICDVHMPKKSGIELVEEIKAGGINSHVPIVMLTTEGQPALVQRAKQAGAKGWIVKPFKSNLLVAAMHKLTAGPAPVVSAPSDPNAHDM